MNDDNFFSINRLVEFGLGVAVARQMTESMNQALSATRIPGIHTPPAAPTLHHYHVLLDGKPAGPFTEQELSRLITSGQLSKDSHVWRPGMAKWDKAENDAYILRLVALSPPPFSAEG
ncbi:DUF4339 domain-containing protein [Pseudoduganella sp. FT93W]|uniref:DUF4339 domain-containing protein n=1 Tax=Duganella fentianensis TaxID=2692177 RepID=A0A845I216_9BURK|nr:DUF4339 domain-containing protein [Duganella fentianensis]MYN47279.1 DUF4339 domain-containing protein [Duganella fentianensis]